MGNGIVVASFFGLNPTISIASASIPKFLLLYKLQSETDFHCSAQVQTGLAYKNLRQRVTLPWILPLQYQFLGEFYFRYFCPPKEWEINKLLFISQFIFEPSLGNVPRAKIAVIALERQSDGTPGASPTL